MSIATGKYADLEDELHETATRETALDDFGDPVYREGLRALLRAYDADLPFTELVRRSLHKLVLTVLIARLYTQKGWTEQPSVLTTPIRRPLLITGLPRTGTTALHKLLSADPQFQGIQLWLMRTPMIRPRRETWKTHKEYHACKAAFESVNTSNPEIRKAHDFVADDVEDCDGVLIQNFVMGYVLSRGLLPTYNRWCSTQDLRESYRRYANVLRLIGGDEPYKTWLLKSPPRMADIDQFLNVFPDARVIQTHRDPLRSIPSHCNLLNLAWRNVYGEAALPEAIGPLESTFWRSALDRFQVVRRKFPQQFFDVDHRRFVAEPLGVIHSIYEYFGLSLSTRAKQQMLAWIATKPTSKHGEHRYSLDSWGITQAQIGEMFSEYRSQHLFG